MCIAHGVKINTTHTIVTINTQQYMIILSKTSRPPPNNINFFYDHDAALQLDLKVNMDNMLTRAGNQHATLDQNFPL